MNNALHTTLRTDDFDFDLPPERIASIPMQQRDQARLLHVKQDGLANHHVYDLPDLLRPNDFLVMNDTKVIPARLYGLRSAMKAEVLLLKRQENGAWKALAKPTKRLRVGDMIVFADDFSAEVMEKFEGGEILLKFNSNDDASFFALLQKHGHMPLPPYIKRPEGDTVADKAQYQTVYAKHEGAVAAPTAGLHFTPELLERLKVKGIDYATVTLHVGAGTFLPVKVDCIKDHVMHSEWGEINAATAVAINAARQAGRRIVAVGTTSLRLLESAADDAGKLRPFAKETAIFIYPGYRFKIVDALMTNFHLPKSTLFMLVSAFAGTDVMQKAYAHAVADNYRFYSYGDATLLEKA